MSVKWGPNGVYFSNNSNSLYKSRSVTFTPSKSGTSAYSYTSTITAVYDIGMMVLIKYKCSGNYGSNPTRNRFTINFDYGKWVIAIRWPYWYEDYDEETEETTRVEGYLLTGTYFPGAALSSDSYNLYSEGKYLHFTSDDPIRVFAWRLE